MKRLHIVLVLFAATASVAHARQGSSGNDSRAVQEAAEAQVTELLTQALAPPGRRVYPELVRSLRILRDPTLRPAFGQLALSARPALRRQGLLGLAELEEPPEVNLLLLSGLEDPAEQAAILGEAIRLSLVSDDQLSELLDWPELDEFLELVVHTRRLEVGQHVDPQDAARLAESENLPISVLGILMQGELGEPDASARADARFSASDRDAEERAASAALIIDSLNRNPWPSAAGFARWLATMYASDPRLSSESLLVWMKLDPEAGKQEWSARLGAADSLSDRLRLALIALAAPEPAGAESLVELERTGDDSEILGIIAALGPALDGSAPLGPALEAALRSGYPPLLSWCTETLPEERPDLAVDSWSVILAAAQREDRDAVLLERAVPPAAAGLAEADAEAMLGWLSDAAGVANDEALCEAMLAGLLRETAPRPWAEGSALVWPGLRSEALATILDARDEQGWTGERLDHLRSIARGWGNLPPVFRVQAAWLAVRHAGDDRETIARVMGGTGGEP